MENIIKSLWKPEKYSHKGQNGKLLVIGGSKEYHGAPVFSLLAARRFVDLLYFHPGEKDDGLILAVKKNVPEAIVIRDLKKIEEVDCVLFGIGLGKAKINFEGIFKKTKRLVVDGDGLKRITATNGLVSLPEETIITPHEGEFVALFGCKGTVENVKIMAARYGLTILKKDPHGDIISNGKKTKINKVHNQGMTKGGTGDVLSGLCAALFCKNDAFTAAYAAARINGLAGNRLKKRFGFNFCASDLAEEVGKTK